MHCSENHVNNRGQPNCTGFLEIYVSKFHLWVHIVKNGETLCYDMNEHQNLQVNVRLVIQHSIGGNVKHIGSLVGFFKRIKNYGTTNGKGLILNDKG